MLLIIAEVYCRASAGVKKTGGLGAGDHAQGIADPDPGLTSISGRRYDFALPRRPNRLAAPSPTPSLPANGRICWPSPAMPRRISPCLRRSRSWCSLGKSWRTAPGASGLSLILTLTGWGLCWIRDQDFCSASGTVASHPLVLILACMIFARGIVRPDFNTAVFGAEWKHIEGV